MNSGKVAIRYAKGLLKFGNEKGIAKPLYLDSLKVINTVRESESLNTVMGNPSIDLDRKIDVLNKVFSSIEPQLLEYLSMIVRKRRVEYLLNSLLLFRDLYRRENNILEVQIETATGLSDKELKEIEDFIRQKYSKSIELTIIHKPELIAGYIMIVEGKILDYSVSGQLAQYKKSLGLSFSN